MSGEPLGAPVEGMPWAREVEHVEIKLRCRLPPQIPARILRGAVIAAVEAGGGASVAWHNHDDRAEAAYRMPEVLYRTNGGPRLWMLGPRAREHAMMLGSRVHALRLPGGSVVAVDGAEVESGSTIVAPTTSKRWRRYELVTPLYPTSVAWKRRPRDAGPERWAWAGQLLGSCVESWLEAAGCTLHRRVHVHLHTFEEERVTWERPGREIRERVTGFRAKFVCNADLPDGVGLGQHRSEGFGEVRRCGC